MTAEDKMTRALWIFLGGAALLFAGFVLFFCVEFIHLLVRWP